MFGADSPHQWIIVVRRDRIEVETRLQQSFGLANCVKVILDRRQGEQREDGWSGAERRRGQGSRPGAREAGRGGGYRMIQNGDGYHVYQAEDRVVARCSECSSAVEFEMPRFVEPPARLAVRVVHLQYAGLPQHLAEIEAFRASGRSFLACRVLAPRPAGSPAPFTTPSGAGRRLVAVGSV